MLQKHTDINVFDSFKEYTVNFGENKVCANATLEWMDNAKKDYMLFRNRVLCNKNHKPMYLLQ